MTVTALRHEMPQAEFLGWSVYHQRERQRAELAAQSGR